MFWLSFADAGTVAGEVARCGGPAAMALRPGFASLTQPDQIALVLSAWCSPLPRLLVFDNCEHPALLERWRPPSGGCRVLLTSRRANWPASAGVRSLALGILAPAESLALLGNHRPDLGANDADLTAISAALGPLPLALHLAGSYLERYRHDPEGNPAAYLAALRRPDLLDHLSLTGGDLSPTGHELHVANSFALSFGKLDREHPVDELARRLLVHAACFAPGEPIPRPLLRLTIETEPAGPVPAVSDAIGRAVELGLLEPRENGALALHRLLAAFLRQQAGEALALAQDEVEAAAEKEADRLNHAGYPAPLAAWLVHLRAIAEAAAERRSAIAPRLFNGLGYHLWMTAELPAARAAYERALRIDEAAFGPDHREVAIDVNNLGLVLQDLGDLLAARAAFERALRINEAEFGPDHPTVAIRVSNLGLVLRDLGDLAAARAALERALRIDEAVFGPEHPMVAIRVNNLGGVLQGLGDLPAARAAHERALRIGEAVLGPEHPNVAIRVNNLGSVLQDTGDLTAARAGFERALRIDEAAFGPEHPNVARDANNLGNVLRDTGDLAAARSAFERALRIGEAAFGPDHPEVARFVNNLGTMLRASGDLLAARAAFERALRIGETVFGPEHPDVALCKNNLGTVLREAGDLPGARAAFEHALAIFSNRLPDGHASIRKVQDNLASLGPADRGSPAAWSS